MQHSLFDRIYMAFLAILISSFVALTLLTGSISRNLLVSERTDSLTNEASLIASQTISLYLTQQYNAEYLATSFEYYSEILHADIWYLDTNGQIIATSDPEVLMGKPKNIYLYDTSYNIRSQFSTSGSFYDLFPVDVVSINVPVIFTTNEGGVETSNFSGALIIHAESSELNSMNNTFFSIIFVPCLVIIVIAFIFLGIISRKIVRPLRKLSAIAAEYSEGNFDKKTEIDSNDEIGSLAQSMEYMAEGLSKLEDYRKDFISNISHDFRSPLTSIRGYIVAMLDGTIPPERQERYLNIVLDETKRLTKLTSGLLDLNNLERFGPYLKLSSFDIIDEIRKTLNTFEIKSIEKNVPIYLNNHSEDTVVTADKEKIKQVIYNLIDNALKFTPAAHNIFVTVMDREEKLVISVRDEGIGMDERTRKNVFVRFYKGDASRGKDKKGSGLGLAITKEIVNAHNESIVVSSSPGEGTEFKFTLPKASHLNDKQPADSASEAEKSNAE